MVAHESELVPFGKYKGRTIDELRLDSKYCDWLSQQPWFREKFQSLHLTIVNAAPEPQETPVHNEMQSRLLDDDFVLCLLHPVWDAPDRRAIQTPKIGKKIFEQDGWDAVVTMSWEHQEDHLRCWRDEGRNFSSTVCYIECKPQIGDDYPQIVRTLKNRKRTHCYDSEVVVWADLFQATVSIEKVRQMFPGFLWLVSS